MIRYGRYTTDKVLNTHTKSRVSGQNEHNIILVYIFLFITNGRGIKQGNLQPKHVHPKS